MEELILELKQQIIEVLNLEDMAPADIETDAPLFGEGLGLDSIDALELIVLLDVRSLASMEEQQAIRKLIEDSTNEKQ